MSLDPLCLLIGDDCNKWEVRPLTPGRERDTILPGCISQAHLAGATDSPGLQHSEEQGRRFTFQRNRKFTFKTCLEQMLYRLVMLEREQRPSW